MDKIIPFAAILIHNLGVKSWFDKILFENHLLTPRSINVENYLV